MSNGSDASARGDGPPEAAVSEVAFVVGEIDPTGAGVRPLSAFRSGVAAEIWAAAWVRAEVEAGRLAVGRDTTEILAVPLDPAGPATDSEVDQPDPLPGVGTASVRADRADVLDEEALPLDELTEPERIVALERLARDVLGEHAASWWATPSRDTWGAAPRALVSSDVGARRVRQVLLSMWRSLLGVYM